MPAENCTVVTVIIIFTWLDDWMSCGQVTGREGGVSPIQLLNATFFIHRFFPPVIYNLVKKWRPYDLEKLRQIFLKFEPCRK